MNRDHKSNKKSGSQEIKLFISSTFRDMNAERDYLVRFVFPRIREELLKHRLFFVDVDLRWGLTSEDNIVGACRSIIEQCHPLFLGILGGRYGWIPEQEDKGISVTEDEIEHAIETFKDSDYKGMFFLFRDDASTLSMRETQEGEFRELKGSGKEIKLLRLKQKIIESGFHMDTYYVDWDDDAQSLTNLQAFGQLVYKYIIDYIESTFGPLREDFAEESDEEEDILDLYINERTRFFIEDELKGNFDDLYKLSLEDLEDKVVLVTGECGAGKSAFLCKFIEKYSKYEKLVIMPYFMGVTPSSYCFEGTLRHLCNMMTKYTEINDPVPYELSKLTLHFQKQLASLKNDKHYVLLLDGLNQLGTEGSARELCWLPNRIPPNVTLVISSAPGPYINTIHKKWPNLHEIELMGLSSDASRKMTEHYLMYYQKKLTKAQIQFLLEKKGSNIPLYLMTAIEEMRMYNDYDSLSDFIKSLPEDTVKLLEWIIDKRISNSRDFTDGYGRNVSSTLTKLFLSYLYISNTGLSEAELIEILGHDAAEGNLAALMRRLRPFLALRGKLLTFYHDDFRKAVHNAFIVDSEEWNLHQELATYFKLKADPDGNNTWNSKDVRHFEQLLFHLLKTGNRKNMACLIEEGFLDTYARIIAPAIFLRDIRTIVDFQIEDETDDFKDIIFHCIRLFSVTAKNIANIDEGQQHPLENAVLEGRDADADALIKSAGIGLKGAILRCAAHTIYNEMGRENRASEVKLGSEYGDVDKDITLSSRLLYSSLNSSVTEDKEATSLEEQKDATTIDKQKDTTTIEKQKDDTLSETQDNTTNLSSLKVKPHFKIPFVQFFLLTAVGKKRKWYGGTLFIVMFLITVLFFADINDIIENALEHIPFISNFNKIIQLIQGIVDLVLFIIPMILLILVIGKICLALLRKIAKRQLLSMAFAATVVKDEKKMELLMRISQYCRLLRETKLRTEEWYHPFLSEVIWKEVLRLAANARYQKAGILAACAVNIENNAEGHIINTFKNMTYDSRYQVLNIMIEHSKILIDKYNVFDIVLKTYDYAPPVHLLLKTLIIQESDNEKNLKDGLSKVSRSILAVSLLRSLKVDNKTVINKNWNNARTLLKTFLIKEPVKRYWYEWIVYLIFVTMLIPAFGLILYMGSTISLFIFAVGSVFYILWMTCYDWRVKQDIPAEVSEFKDTLVEKMKQGSNKDKISSYRGTAVVETTLVDMLLEGSDHRNILSYFSGTVIVKVFTCMLRPGFTRKSSRLITSLLDTGEMLPEILDKISNKKTKPNKTPNEVEKNNQWKRMRHEKRNFNARMAFITISLLISLFIMILLCFLSDPWLKILLIHRGYIILAVTLTGIFIPITRIRYAVILAPIIMLLLPSSWTILVQENFIYFWIPPFSIWLGNEIMKIWNCNKLLYPTVRERLYNRVKSILLFVSGSFILCIIILFINRGLTRYEENIQKTPWQNTVVVLQNYAALNRKSQSAPDLYAENIINKLDKLITRRLPFQFKLAERADDGMNMYQTWTDLELYQYTHEAEKIKHLMVNYVGWCYVRRNANDRMAFFDDVGREVYPCVVVILTLSGSQAEKRGIERGDVIKSIGEINITSVEDIHRVISDSKDSTTKIPVIIKRGSKTIEFSVNQGTLGVILGYVDVKFQY